MSEGLGPQVYMVEDGGFLGSSSQRLAMSDETENQVDREIRGMLDESYHEAVAILSNERLFLSVLADILMQVETVDGEEFDIIYSCSVKKKHEFQMETDSVEACETDNAQA
jgi:cell division protease FtsH